jgi:MoxR-like ATPase
VHDVQEFSKVQGVVAAIGKVVIGKEHQVKLAVACMLAGGHLLIEDVPGVGKTTLAHCLAHVFGLDYRRVQFTSDLMPSDIIGSSVWIRERSQFEFLPGPLFAQLVLADEINRAPPRAQSALIEAMEEGKATVDGVSRKLPDPFFVIATQNPVAHLGTYPLPESQLDRFNMVVSLGYPAHAEEEALLLGGGRSDFPPAMMTSQELVVAQSALSTIYVSPELARYVRALASQTRGGSFIEGLSPRAALALVRSARAWAALEGSREVHPEHVQAVFLAVARHRVRVRTNSSEKAEALLAKTLRTVPV